jgi:hypothetical protein
MLKSKTARWIMWLFLAWLLLTACTMGYSYAVAFSVSTSPLMVGATIGSLGLIVCGAVVFARIATWPLRRHRSRADILRDSPRVT